MTEIDHHAPANERPPVGLAAWTEHYPGEGEHARWVCGKCARTAALGEDDGQIAEHHRTCPKRADLSHQLQEYTDTTARYEAGEDVVPGDCWRACLASLLEVPLARVPHFIHLYRGLCDHRAYELRCRLQDGHGPSVPHLLTAEVLEPLGPRWWLESIAWVEQQRPGWTLRAWDRPEPWTPFYQYDWSELSPEDQEQRPARVILTGPSPRGAWNHSVLVDAQTGELEHDPFPGGQGVLPGPGDRIALVREEWL